MSRPATPDADERDGAAHREVQDPTADRPEVLGATNLVKRFGRVTAVDGADFSLRAGEILAVIGDNGAGKSTLIKCLSGAVTPDSGEMRLNGTVVTFADPLEARGAGIETVHQSLAVSPSLDIAANLFLGRERRKKGILGSVFRQLDHRGMRNEAARHLDDLGVLTVQNMTQAVETLSGGQRQAVSVARAAAFGSRVVIMDEPTAALGVKESNRVLRLIEEVRDKGMPVVLISHNMPHVFEIADRIHIHRLGRRACVVTPQSHSMQDTVAIMTGALPPPEHDAA